MTDRCLPTWPWDPRELVPGDMDAFEALARDMLLLARDAAQARSALAGVDPEGWAGTAAEEFRGLLGELPARLVRAEEAFRAAGAALYQHLEVVASARGVVRSARELFESGNARTRAWLEDRARLEAATSTYGPYVPGALPVVAPEDPGEPDRREARRRLQSALDEIERSGDRAAARLRRAADEAPRGPSLRDQVLRGVRYAGRAPIEYYLGVGDALLGTATFAMRTSPSYALVNPRGAMRYRKDLGLGVFYAAQHPWEATKVLVGLELLKENPARWAGGFAFDAALATATYGASGAVAVGSRTGRVATRFSALAVRGGISPRLVAIANRRFVPKSPIDPWLRARDSIGTADELADRHRAAELGRLSSDTRSAPGHAAGSS